MSTDFLIPWSSGASNQKENIPKVIKGTSDVKIEGEVIIICSLWLAGFDLHEQS